MTNYEVIVVENVFENYSVEATSPDKAERMVWAGITRPEAPLPPSLPGGGNGDPEIVAIREVDA